MAAQRPTYVNWASECVIISNVTEGGWFFSTTREHYKVRNDDLHTPTSRGPSKLAGWWLWNDLADWRMDDASTNAVKVVKSACNNATQAEACQKCLCCRGCACQQTSSMFATLVVGATAAALLLYLATCAAAYVGHRWHGVTKRNDDEQLSDDRQPTATDSGSRRPGQLLQAHQNDDRQLFSSSSTSERRAIRKALAQWEIAGLISAEKREELQLTCAEPAAWWRSTDHSSMLRSMGTATLLLAIVVALMENKAASLIRLFMAPLMWVATSQAMGKAFALLGISTVLQSASTAAVHSTRERKWGPSASTFFLVGEFCFWCSVGAWLLAHIDTGNHPGETSRRGPTGRVQHAGGNIMWWRMFSLLGYLISGPLRQVCEYARVPDSKRELVLAPLALILFSLLQDAPFASLAGGVALALHGEVVEWRARSYARSYSDRTWFTAVVVVALVTPVVYMMQSAKSSGMSLALGASILLFGELAARRAHSRLTARSTACCWYTGTALLVLGLWSWMANVALAQVVSGFGLAARSARRQARHDSNLRYAISAVAVAPALVAYAYAGSSKRRERDGQPDQTAATVLRVVPSGARAHSVGVASCMLMFAFVRLTSSWVLLKKEKSDGVDQHSPYMSLTPVLRLAMYAASAALAALHRPNLERDVRNTIIDLHMVVLWVCLEVLSVKGTWRLDGLTREAYDALYDLGEHHKSYQGRAQLLPWGLPSFIFSALILRWGRAGTSSYESPITTRRASGVVLFCAHSIIFATFHLLAGPSWSSLFLTLSLLFFCLPTAMRVLSTETRRP